MDKVLLKKSFYVYFYVAIIAVLYLFGLSIYPPLHNVEIFNFCIVLTVIMVGIFFLSLLIFLIRRFEVNAKELMNIAILPILPAYFWVYITG